MVSHEADKMDLKGSIFTEKEEMDGSTTGLLPSLFLEGKEGFLPTPIIAWTIGTDRYDFVWKLMDPNPENLQIDYYAIKNQTDIIAYGDPKSFKMQLKQHVSNYEDFEAA